MTFLDRSAYPRDLESDPGLEPPGSPEAEALLVLRDHADEELGGPLGAAVALHVAAVCADGDLSIKLAALQAIVQRLEHAQVAELRVSRRPRAVHGAWTVGGGRGDAHEVWLESLAPLRTSCACADFCRSGLGLCEHGLVVLSSMSARTWSRKLESPASRGPLLRWDPSRPMDGDDDRVARLVLDGSIGRRIVGLVGGRPSAVARRDDARRQDLLEALAAAVASRTVGAEPAVHTVLREELGNVSARRESGAALEGAMSTLGSLRRHLYPDQRTGVQRFLERGRLLLGDDMGLGKTTQAIAGCHALHRSGRVRRSLFVVPASLKPQWRREWTATTDVPVTIVDGTPDVRAAIYAGTTEGVLVVGYEQLLRDQELVRRFDPELVVLDEAQRIKNHETKTAAAVRTLSPRYRLALTGTPMQNRLSELASVAEFVDGLALGPSWRLTPRHTYSEGDGAEGRSGARHLDELRRRLGPVMLRRLRTEVIAQLPERTDTTVPVAMTAPQLAAHDDLAQSIASLMRMAERRPLRRAEFERLMRLLAQQRIVCNGLAQRDFEATWDALAATRPTPTRVAALEAPKLEALRTLVSELCVTQRRKVVVFSEWRRMLRLSEWAIRDILGAAGLRAGFFTGAESPKLREQALVDFHDDPNFAVLFLTDAGGVGLNLQRAASACIQLELPWNPAVIEQRIGRIYRLGQSRPIDVFHLVSEAGIEGRISGLIGRKRALASTLFDGTSNEVRFDGSRSFVDTVRVLSEPSATVTTRAAEDVPASEPSAVDAPSPTAAADANAIDANAIDAATPPAAIPSASSEAVTPCATPAPASGSAAAEEPSASPPVAAATSATVGTGHAATAPPAIPPVFQVQRRADGGLTLDVPPAFAAPLADLLASLAAALRPAATAPDPVLSPGETPPTAPRPDDAAMPSCPP